MPDASADQLFDLADQIALISSELLRFRLRQRAREAELFQLRYHEKKSLQERMGLAATAALDGVLLRWWSRLSQPRFWQ